MATSATKANEHTSTYNQGYSAAVIASHASRTVDNSAAFLLPHLKPHFAILDLGCGPGTITRGFCQYVPDGKVVGIDFSDDVIYQAQSLISKSQYPNLEFVVGNLVPRMPFDEESFDVIYTHQCLLHIPDAVRVVRQAHRVLKPGGILAMREADTAFWHPNNPGVEAYTKALGEAISPGAQGWGAGRRLHVWAKEAGFDPAKMQVGTGGTTYAAPDLARWWGGTHIDRLKGEVGQKWLKEGRVVKRQADIDAMIDGLAVFSDDPTAWYTTLQGEVIAWK
jgi:ubiquinone/menaquinone biosynthesis C-methylase UbiE